MLCFYTRSKQTSIHPQNTTPCLCMIPLSPKHIKDMGLCKRKIKDAYPKKVCHMLRHVKKRGEIKDAYPKTVCHMLRHVKKKREKIAPYPKRKEKERRFIQRSSYTIHPKYPHNCTSWSRFMTYFSFGSGHWLSKNMRSKYAFKPSISTNSTKTKP